MFDLLKRQSELPFAGVAVDPGYHSARHVAGLDRFVPPVADGVEKKERLLTDPYTIVIKYGVRFAPLSIPGCEDISPEKQPLI